MCVQQGQANFAPLTQQESVDSEAAKWADVWQQGVVGNHPRWPADMGQVLPDLAVAQLREACYTFPSGVGLGWDKLHPRALVRCSDRVLGLFIQMLILAEILGEWPSCIGPILIILLPKSDGGRRPIGLFPSLIRLWMRVRLQVAQQWLLDNDRAYFYAGLGSKAS